MNFFLCVVLDVPLAVAGLILLDYDADRQAVRGEDGAQRAPVVLLFNGSGDAGPMRKPLPLTVALTKYLQSLHRTTGPEASSVRAR